MYYIGFLQPKPWVVDFIQAGGAPGQECKKQRIRKFLASEISSRIRGLFGLFFQIRGPFAGVPMIRVIVFSGSILGPPYVLETIISGCDLSRARAEEVTTPRVGIFRDAILELFETELAANFTGKAVQGLGTLCFNSLAAQSLSAFLLAC